MADFVEFFLEIFLEFLGIVIKHPYITLILIGLLIALLWGISSLWGMSVTSTAP